MKRTFSIVLAMTAIIIAGCGGGGGGNIDSSAPNQPNPPVGPITFNVSPGEEATQSIGTLVVNVPADVFPTGATVTVSQTVPAAQDRPPNEDVSCNKINISSTKIPQGSIEITVNGLASQTRGLQQTVYLLLKKAGSLWTKVADSKTGKFVIDSAEFISDGPISRAGVIIGKIFVNEPSDATSMVPFGSDDTSEKVIKNSALVIVHGFNDGLESFKLLAQNFASEHKYQQIYLFGYDWRQSCASSAEKLGVELDKLADANKQIYVAAHSMGVVVYRHNSKQPGKSKNVQDFYAICGANLGSALATAGEILQVLQNDYLNRLPGDHLLNGFPIGNVESIQDLVPGSQFLNSLNNSVNTNQNNKANFYLIGSTNDTVVGLDSGIARGVTQNSLTEGMVKYYTTNGFGHSGLVKTPSGISKLFTLIADSSAEEIIFTEDEVNVYSDWDGWRFNIAIDNNGRSDAYLTDLRMDQYDRFGNWYAACWYNPNLPEDVIYSEEYVRWDQRLGVGENLAISIHTWPDSDKNPISQVADKLKAESMVFTLRYGNVRGALTSTTSTIRMLQTEGYSNSPPNIRSPSFGARSKIDSKKGSTSVSK